MKHQFVSLILEKRNVKTSSDKAGENTTTSIFVYRDDVFVDGYEENTDIPEICYNSGNAAFIKRRKPEGVPAGTGINYITTKPI